MNTEFYNFSRNLDSLTEKEMYVVSEKLNTIEPGVGEVSRILPLLENLTFLDCVSIAFVMTLIVFAFMPKIKKSRAWSSIRAAASR